MPPAARIIGTSAQASRASGGRRDGIGSAVSIGSMKTSGETRIGLNRTPAGRVAGRAAIARSSSNACTRAIAYSGSPVWSRISTPG